MRDADQPGRTPEHQRCDRPRQRNRPVLAGSPAPRARHLGGAAHRQDPHCSEDAGRMPQRIPTLLSGSRGCSFHPRAHPLDLRHRSTVLEYVAQSQAQGPHRQVVFSASKQDIRRRSADRRQHLAGSPCRSIRRSGRPSQQPGHTLTLGRVPADAAQSPTPEGGRTRPYNSSITCAPCAFATPTACASCSPAQSASTSCFDLCARQETPTTPSTTCCRSPSHPWLIKTPPT